MWVSIFAYWIVDASLELVSVLLMIDGTYQETVFHLGEQIISPTFADLQLTVDDVLNADIWILIIVILSRNLALRY